ncbi:MAG: glycosyltransferase family 2 protein, partial [Verrucomicrobiota bacterium]
MKVSFIVPVFNETRLTKACLESLEATLPIIDYEIILVDDGSLPEIACELDQLTFKNLTVIHAPKNQGFAAANNLGVRHSNGEILFLINNDLVLQPGWFEPMRTAFDRFPDLGIIGNIQLNATTKEIDHAGCLIGWGSTISHKKTPNKIGAYSPFETITAACCAISKELFIRHGGFDESYQNGCEDTELCFRLRKSGYRVLVANRSTVQHHVSTTRGVEKSQRQDRNFRILQRRWSQKLQELSSQAWPKHYIRQVLSQPSLCSRPIAFEALSQWLFKTTSPKAQLISSCFQERNERHWLSTIENWNDDMIKNFERRKFSNWLKNKFEYEGLYINSDRAEGL